LPNITLNRRHIAMPKEVSQKLFGDTIPIFCPRLIRLCAYIISKVPKVLSYVPVDPTRPPWGTLVTNENKV